MAKALGEAISLGPQGVSLDKAWAREPPASVVTSRSQSFQHVVAYSLPGNP